MREISRLKRCEGRYVAFAIKHRHNHHNQETVLLCISGDKALLEKIQVNGDEQLQRRCHSHARIL